MTKTAPERVPGFSIFVDPEHATFEGREERLDADETARKLVAERLGVPAVNRLKGVFVVRRTADGLEVNGTLDAALTRVCVVSLEPMDEVINEDFDISYSTSGAPPEGAIELDLDPDAVEPLPEAGVDLGDILIEQLALAIDPYPRQEGAPSLAKAYGATPEASPFSALRSLFAGETDKG